MKALPLHHPNRELLIARAAGALDPAISLVLSAHLDLCPRCAERAGMLDSVGGALLEATDPVAMSPGALDRVMARLDSEDSQPPAGQEGIVAETLKSVGLDQIPSSLKPLTAAAARTGGWRERLGGVKELLLRKEPDGTEMRYLLIPPGTGVPRHGHKGMEFTLVLKGAFRDETGYYRRGDLEVASDDLTHRPVADHGEPCLSLAVTNAPLQFTGTLGVVQRAFGAN